jgi:ferredoxin
VSDSLPDRNMFDIFSQGLFEGVKPMMVIRDHLVRHPDRCTHQAICVPICPTGAWLSTPPYKFDASRCLESCRLCLDACPSQAIFAVFKKGRSCWSRKRRRGSLAVPFAAQHAASEGCEGAGRPFFLLAEPP